MDNNVPQWMLDSTTAPTEQNKEVDLIVADFIGAFRKFGFSQQQMGILMTSAFLLPAQEVEKRLDAVLSCAANEEEGKNLCAYLVQKGYLFAQDNADPCEIIGILKGKYGNEAAFETMLTFGQLLSLWKSASVRDDERYENEKSEVERILHEVSSVFPEIS
ncbi:MAG: hypothetical protein J6Q83_04095 [Clostridia bacterium]|nr:hypothetical protein [Clostridia bacterium]